MTPEYIALLRQQQALIAQMEDIVAQFEAVTKALLPPLNKKKKKFNPEEWGRELERRLKGKKT